MTEKAKTAPQEPKMSPQEPKKATGTQKVTEPKKEPYIAKYTIEELAAEAKGAFGTHKVVVQAALKKAGKDSYSMQEATSIVNKFKSKEVKK